MATPTGHHHPRRPDTDRRTITGEENRLKALQLRKAGLPYHAIGHQLGTTSQYACKLVKAALANLRTCCAEATENLRQLELERLDALLMSLWTPASRGDHAAIDRVLKIMERRARLLGLDAPVKQMEVPPTAENLRHELAEMLDIPVTAILQSRAVQEVTLPTDAWQALPTEEQEPPDRGPGQASSPAEGA